MLLLQSTKEGTGKGRKARGRMGEEGGKGERKKRQREVYYFLMVENACEDWVLSGKLCGREWPSQQKKFCNMNLR